MNLDQAQSLEAIAEHGSFSAAARALNKAQSAVSYDIKQLESRLGLDLFDRAGHRARLTPQGRAILEECRLLLARARRITSLADRFRDGWEPRLEVVIDGILPMDPIMGILKMLAEEKVPTRIQMKVEYLGGVQARFDMEKADIMLTKGFENDGSLISAPMAAIVCVLVAAPEHPLAQASRHRTLTLPDLQEHVELTVHDSSESNRSDDPHMFGGSRVFYLSDFHSKYRGLTMGLGFGWMPTYLVREDLAEGRLVELCYEAGSRFRFVPHMVHRINHPLGKTGRRFLALLEQLPPP
ncbi:LysR family transcriptional regulator [Sulfidibacter corallicola]|uniref:LysR family transcriptional regulator n=1 Tax=Sulfidibacter corallicola TaxID=2818388 RepID=A0A8A4TYF7_SULCO|nr:LysR family transcriptional regulator [Sulfidibacter corallicola]QTD51565.1 LysR family transcriptional regulator [Sulfidibacter corallicola]